MSRPSNADPKPVQWSPPTSSTSPTADASASSAVPHWRSVVSSSFQKRRQTPSATKATLSRLAAKTEAILPLKLPRLPTNNPALHQDGDALFSSSASASSTSQLSPRSLRRNLRKQFESSQMAYEQQREAQMAYSTSLEQQYIQNAIEEQEQDEAKAAEAAAGGQEEKSGDDVASDLPRARSASGLRPSTTSSSLSDRSASASSHRKTPSGVRLSKLSATAQLSPSFVPSAWPNEEKKESNAEMEMSSTGGEKKKRSSRDHGKPTSPSRKKKSSRTSVSPTKSQSSTTSTTTTASSIIRTADPDELYKVFRSELDKLPLELFDNPSEENDRSPEEWVALGAEEAGGGGQARGGSRGSERGSKGKDGSKTPVGTPARSLFYVNREWQWSPCRVLSYDASTAEFTIAFSHPTLIKRVKRLSILFDAEDPARFSSRLERCRSLREQALASRRYASFIEEQNPNSFAPIQQQALHGIVGRLMIHCEQLVMKRQHTVEELLIEVRDEYARAMKSAILNEIRRDAEQEKALVHLRLPPPPPLNKPKAPYLAVIPTPEREQSIDKLIQTVEQQHFTHHPEATQVILALYRSWDQVKGGRFVHTHQVHMPSAASSFSFQAKKKPGKHSNTIVSSTTKMMELEEEAAAAAAANDESSSSSSSSTSMVPLKTPLTLYEYQDIQEAHFTSLREKVTNDWRALVINLIRDNLNNVYKLFVNDIIEYESSELKRFLKMVTFMLRYQLSTLIIDSIDAYVESFQVYSKPLKGIVERERERERRKGEKNEEEIMRDVNEETVDILDDYLNGKGNATVDDELENEDENMDADSSSTSSTTRSAPLAGAPPLFVFKMSTSGKEVIFLPGLEMIEQTVLSLVNIPSKLQVISQIDNDVVPLLGMGEIPLCHEKNVPELYSRVDAAKVQLREIIHENIKQPIALAELYQQFGSLLSIDVLSYVHNWFHPIDLSLELENERKIKIIPTTIEEQIKLDEEAARLREEEARKEREKAKKKEYNPWELAGDEAKKIAEQEEKRLADEEEEKRKEDAKPKGHTLAETEAEIQKYIDAITAISNVSPSEVTFKMIKVECQMLKEQLITKAKEILNQLLEGLATQIRELNMELTKKFEAFLSRIKMKSEDVAQLAELKAFTKKIEGVEIPKLKSEIESMQAQISTLMSFRYPISRSDFNLSWSVVRYPLHLVEAMEEAKLQLELDNMKFQKQLQDEQSTFQSDLEEFSHEVDSFADFGSASAGQMELYANKVEALQEKLNKAERQVESFNHRDAIFGESLPMEYNELIELRKKFKPYFELWNTTNSINMFLVQWSASFNDLNPEHMSKEVNGWHKLMFRLEKDFQAANSFKAAQVAAEMKNKVAAFKSHLPIITWLRNPGMRPRHWDRLSVVLRPGQMPLNPEDITLATILSLPIHQHKAEIEEVCSSALKEHAIEASLLKMQKDWDKVIFDLEPYKATKTYILKGSEDILTLLDDQIMKTQAMRGSPYIKTFEKKIRNWEKRMLNMSQIMEEWLLCQKTWIHLESIFSSEDIMRQMPIEARRFGVVDAYWKKTMEAAKKASTMLEFVHEQEGLLKTFQESNKMLDLIGKHLNEYLETKRLAFPRFYFLSNEELISILSQTKHVAAVNLSLSKCFDGMNKLNFTEKQLIMSMSSAEGEEVKFDEKIDPNEGAKKGNVEIWLKEVERVMKDSLRTSITRSLLAYPEGESESNGGKREDWITSWPGQVILAVSQCMWTKQVTQALKDVKSGGLRSYMTQLNAQLDALVAQVRRSDLSPLHRLTLGALTVIDVHARDVVQNMMNENVTSDKDFEWLAQLRYYWEADDRVNLARQSIDGVPNGTLRVRIVNTTLDYQNEYTGNSTRLVITPLTDRCYRTLMGAVHLHLGGAPEGPAGTGKTETVKDLSKAVAIQCLVFNCSDGLNFKSMAKFFKGLAASGAWSCFDEFNRIELEVLSVIAQQISSIQRAIIEGKHTFIFDGQNLPLIHSCSLFITMNPGYAGRSELPDNLKTLFRSVAMMVPDYALIAEIVLYSSGYSGARALARKIVTCLKLCSEQLSAPVHYDWGMRNVKSILSTAGVMKASEPTASEEWLAVRAISDCNVPKLVSADMPLFNSIVKDLFPNVDSATNERNILTQAVVTAMEQANLQPVPTLVHKCIELYDTICVRHGLMLVGAAYSGKSKSLSTLAAALTSLAPPTPSSTSPFACVDVHYLNPKSLRTDELYGRDSAATSEWVDGVLPVIMREAVTKGNETGAWQWIVCDGPVDAQWIENLNTVLDDNKKLCLASGEQIKLLNHMNMVFEVEDLNQASPATVSRCGMIFMEPSLLGTQSLVDSFLNAIDPMLASYVAELRSLFSWILPPTLEFIFKNTHSVVNGTSEMTLVASCCRLLETMLEDVKKVKLREKEKEMMAMKAAEAAQGTGENVVVSEAKNNENKNSDESSSSSSTTAPAPASNIDDQNDEEYRSQWVESLFLLSIIWSIGCNTDTIGRRKFSDFFRELTSGKLTNNTIYTYPTLVSASSASAAASASPSPRSPRTISSASSDDDNSVATTNLTYTVSTLNPEFVGRKILLPFLLLIQITRRKEREVMA